MLWRRHPSDAVNEMCNDVGNVMITLVISSGSSIESIGTTSETQWVVAQPSPVVEFSGMTRIRYGLLERASLSRSPRSSSDASSSLSHALICPGVLVPTPPHAVEKVQPPTELGNESAWLAASPSSSKSLQTSGSVNSIGAPGANLE